jgi:hypothetical protein
MATATEPRIRRRRTASEFLPALVAAGGLVLGAVALGLVMTDDGGGGNPTIELGEMYIEGDLTVDAGATVTVVNAGSVPHNLAVDGGPSTPDLNAAQAADLDLAALDPATYTVFCSIEGHRAAGMEAELVIG